MNLVTNAIKFHKAGEAPKVSIAAARKGSDWVISVSDNGIGFEQQHTDRIFSLFQRLHGVGAYPGTGMGLAICKRVVEQHGGQIWAKSELGSGAIFTFTLPENVSLSQGSE